MVSNTVIGAFGRREYRLQVVPVHVREEMAFFLPDAKESVTIWYGSGQAHPLRQLGSPDAGFMAISVRERSRFHTTRSPKNVVAKYGAFRARATPMAVTFQLNELGPAEPDMLRNCFDR